jgi:hypothetical protein
MGVIQLMMAQKGSVAPTNYYTLANAANPNSEVNATTGITDVPNFTVSSVSSLPTADNGTYCLKFTRSGVDNTSYDCLITLSGLTIGSTYKIDCRMNRYNGGNWQIKLDNSRGWVSDLSGLLITTVTNPTTNVWFDYTITGVANSATPVIRVAAQSNSDIGNALAIDNIIITQI